MICIDATPLQSEHRFRGIGFYTASLLQHLSITAMLLRQQFSKDEEVVFAELRHRGFREQEFWRPRHPRYRLQWLWSQIILPGAIRRSRARLFHATDFNGVVFGNSFKTIATLYDLIPLRLYGPELRGMTLDARLGYGVLLQAIRKAHHLIAISEATKRDAVSLLKIPEERISVVPLACDEKRFPGPSSMEAVQQVSQKHGLHQRYFLYVGSAESHKNLDRTLQALANLEQTDVILVTVGKWSISQTDWFQNRVKALRLVGRVKHLGYIPDADLPALYTGAEAFVFPSLIEGFGLPVLEAMTCGAPVITSAGSALAEVVGDAALLVDPMRVTEIRETMQAILTHVELRTQLKALGMARSRQFSWTRTARLTESIYGQQLRVGRGVYAG